MTPTADDVYRATGQKPKVFINSLPKAGTHLLLSVLRLLPGFAFRRPILSRKLRRHPLNYLLFRQPETCLVGIGQPGRVKLAVLRRIIGRLPPGGFLMGHVPFQQGVQGVLQDAGARTLLMLRDPRDVVVSQVHYVLGKRSHFLHRHFRALPSGEERLLAAICGTGGEPDAPQSLGIAQKLTLILGWQGVDSVLSLRFEDVIGPQGGGDAAAQQTAILALGRHLGLGLSRAEAGEIGRRAFGRGGTYRQGQIGGWRACFGPRVKTAFKAQAGEQLIQMGYEQDFNW
ncbi:MAG: hypothetical protein ACE5G8_03435 [Anaerolineae bacterium]